VVLPFNPDDPLNVTKLANFKAKYGVGASVQLVGGFSGHLDDGGETLQLQRPDGAVPGSVPPFYPPCWKTRSATTRRRPGRKAPTAVAVPCSGWR